MRLFTRRAALAGALLLALPLAPDASAQFFRANLSGASEVPPNGSTGFGAAIGFLSGSQFTMAGAFRGLGSNYLASHIHEAPAGSNGPIAVGLNPTVDADQRGGRWESTSHSFALTGGQVTALTGGNLYVNVHSSTLGGGEIRGQFGPTVVLNEVRIDQPGTDNDEYVEWAGPPGTSLDGMTFLVIGDGAGGSGVSMKRNCCGLSSCRAFMSSAFLDDTGVRAIQNLNSSGALARQRSSGVRMPAGNQARSWRLRLITCASDTRGGLETNPGSSGN